MNPGTDGILRLDGVTYAYGDRVAARNVSVAVEDGGFIGLIGANGSGKSTILKLSAGILKPQAGSVRLWGRPIADYPGKDRAKLISYLPQMLQVNVPFRVRELVGMGGYPYDTPPGLSPDEAIATVGLSDRSGAFITSLSGGELRRVFIAMTLVQGAGVVLLDEPLANLDIRYQIELIRLLKGLRDDRGMSVFMALHDIGLAFQFEKICVIKDGSVLAEGPPRTIVTEDLLFDAFGVSVTIDHHANGTVSLGY